MRARTVWITIAGAAALVVAGGVALWMLRPADPASIAADYAAALESGDAAALDALGVALSPEAAEAFAAATHVADARVGEVEIVGDDAQVGIEYTLDGAPYESELLLHRDEGQWELAGDNVLGAVTFAAAPAAYIRLDDAPWPVSVPLALPPASYTATVLPADLLEGAASFTVSPGVADDVRIDATILPSASAAAQESLDALVEACTGATDAIPDGCGLRIPWAADLTAVTGIRFTVEKSPRLVLDDRGFSATGGALVATVTGTAPDGASTGVTYRTDSWTLIGATVFTEDGVDLVPFG